MYLATEYLVRSKAVRKLLRLPCSLFVVDLTCSEEKKVVTINASPRLPKVVVVKHWFVQRSSPDQVLPSMQEFLINQDYLFDDPHIVIPQHRLLPYMEEPVPFHLNSTHHPTINETYNFYCNNYLSNQAHLKLRENWLWSEFIRIYAPSLWSLTQLSLSVYKSELEILTDQRSIMHRHYQDRWLYWLKWRKYMLDFEGIPGELAFLGEYN